MQHEDFKVGMKVKMYDEGDKKTVIGRVDGVFDEWVSIHWEDLSASTNHHADEYPLISPAEDFKYQPILKR
jgi:hypothetical protein